MLPMRAPLCVNCKRFNRDSFDPVTCSSFPEGIPDLYFDAVVGHLNSDHGEPTFEGVIPPSWFALAPSLDGDDEPPTPTRKTFDFERGGFVTKGDYEGHPFRGNQWTGGQGGAEDDGDTTPPRAEAEPLGFGQKYGSGVNLAVMAGSKMEMADDLRSLDLWKSPGAFTGHRTFGLKNEEEAKAFVERQHEVAKGVLERMNVKITGGGMAQGNHPEAAALGRQAEAVSMLRMIHTIENLPEGTRALLAEKGLTLEMKTFDPAVDKFTAAGKEFNRGGSAYMDSEGRAFVTLVSFTNELYTSDESGSHEYKMPNAVAMSVIAHEMGHISVDTSGFVQAQRDALSQSPAYREANDLWNNVSGSRLEMKEMAGTYRRAADDFQKALTEGRVPTDQRGGVEDLVAHYRREAEAISESVKALYPIQERTGELVSKVSDFTTAHAEALAGLTKAVDAEGGITDYAETWRSDSRYGTGGLVKDPVHRGVHESVAEIEDMFLRAQKAKPMTEAQFAKALSNGDAKTLLGFSEIRDRHATDPDKAGELEGVKYPRLAQAWREWRKVIDKAPKRTPGTSFKLTKQERETLRNHGLNRTYHDWQRYHDRLMSEIDTRLLDFAKNTEGTYPGPAS